MTQLTNYEEDLVNRLQDEEFAREYVKASLEQYFENDEPEVLCLALYYLTLSKGTIAQRAKETGLNRENLYRMFKAKQTPSLGTIQKLIAPFKLTVA